MLVVDLEELWYIVHLFFFKPAFWTVISSLNDNFFAIWQVGLNPLRCFFDGNKEKEVSHNA